MGAVSLDLIRKHVRADDFDDDNELLQFYADAAEKQVLALAERQEDDLIDEGGGQWPAPLQQAVLMLVGHWYNQREAVSGANMQVVPYGVASIIAKYRKLHP